MHYVRRETDFKFDKSENLKNTVNKTWKKYLELGKYVCKGAAILLQLLILFVGVVTIMLGFSVDSIIESLRKLKKQKNILWMLFAVTVIAVMQENSLTAYAAEVNNQNTTIIEEKDWFDECFVLNDKLYQLPFNLSELTDNGWSINWDANKDIGPEGNFQDVYFANPSAKVPRNYEVNLTLNYDLVENAEKHDTRVVASNSKFIPVKIENAEVYNITFTQKSLNELKCTLILPKGVIFGNTAENIQELYGCPIESSEISCAGIKTFRYKSENGDSLELRFINNELTKVTFSYAR